jgi:hypothetical protein
MRKLLTKGFDFFGFRLNYDKIILAKSCLANIIKTLNALYEQLSKSKSGSYKNRFTITALLKKIKLYVLKFGRWACVVQQTLIKNCGAKTHHHIQYLIWFDYSLISLVETNIKPRIIHNRR